MNVALQLLKNIVSKIVFLKRKCIKTRNLLIQRYFSGLKFCKSDAKLNRCLCTLIATRFFCKKLEFFILDFAKFVIRLSNNSSGNLKNRFDITNWPLCSMIDYKLEKYEDKFGQFAKKRETAMKSIQKETALLDPISHQTSYI